MGNLRYNGIWEIPSHKSLIPAAIPIQKERAKDETDKSLANDGKLPKDIIVFSGIFFAGSRSESGGYGRGYECISGSGSRRFGFVA